LPVDFAPAVEWLDWLANLAEQAGNPTGLQSGGAFRIANGLFHRQNDYATSQTSEEERRPMGMVSDLNRENLPSIQGR
jgi:hypothetical protein